MINTLLFFARGKEVAKIVNFFGLLTFALKKSIFVLTTLRHYLKLLKFLRAMSKTWKESKAVKQGRSEKGRPKPKMEPYKKGTKNKKEIY